MQNISLQLLSLLRRICLGHILRNRDNSCSDIFCFVTDETYAKYIATTIISITENMAETDSLHFYIIHEDISGSSQELLKIALQNKGEIDFINIKEKDIYLELTKIKQKSHYITKASYFKFAIAELLKDFDRVIFLDNDIIVKQSLADLYNSNLDGMLMGAVEDVGYTYWKDYSPEFKLKHLCVNSGVLVIDCNKWRECNLAGTLIKAAQEDILKNFGQDQPIFNYVCKDKIKFLDYRWNVQGSFLREEPERANNINKELIIEAASHPAIIHYAGCAKPWNNPEVLKGDEWTYYQEQLDKITPAKYKLQICLITYNRKAYLERTLNQILDEDSPIRDFDITILDNASTDGTSELIQQYCQKYPNIKFIRHAINIGGNANILEAFRIGLASRKEYFWGLCDDDQYDFSNWAEVENCIMQKKDVICVSNYAVKYKQNEEISLSDKLIQMTFFPAGIFKTNLLEANVFMNMTYSISDCFPHLCPTIHAINQGKDITIISKPIVFNGLHCPKSCKEFSYTRGADNSEKAVRFENSSWILGYANVLNMLNIKKNEKKKLITSAILHEEIYGSWKHFYNDMFARYLNKHQYNYLYEIFSLLPIKRTFEFLLSAITLKLHCGIDYCSNKQDWINYFEKKHLQNKLDKLSQKLSGKKVLLYGNGMVSKIIQEDYDLSKFDIVAVTDRKYLGRGYSSTEKYMTIPPNKVDTLNYDVILVALKQSKNIKQMLRDNGSKKEIVRLIK